MDDEAEFMAGFYGEAFARFDGLGKDSVPRLLRCGNIAAQDREMAHTWVERNSREAAAAREAIDKEDRTIAISTNDAVREQAHQAKQANKIAKLMLVIAMISIFATIIVAFR